MVVRLFTLTDTILVVKVQIKCLMAGHSKGATRTGTMALWGSGYDAVPVLRCLIHEKFEIWLNHATLRIRLIFGSFNWCFMTLLIRSRWEKVIKLFFGKLWFVANPTFQTTDYLTLTLLTCLWSQCDDSVVKIRGKQYFNLFFWIGGIQCFFTSWLPLSNRFNNLYNRECDYQSTHVNMLVEHLDKRCWRYSFGRSHSRFHALVSSRL